MSRLPAQITIPWLRDQYRSGSLKPLEVVEEIIIRMNRTKAMNIWITPPKREFIQPYLEGLAALRLEDTPLWGIPFAIKDNIDLTGMPTTAGCPAYSYMPQDSATTVKRLVQAGAIPLGKTNLDQFATGLVGIRSPYGEVHNALRDEMISGGSSSGSAVAVARGQAVFALGTDTAGSGRVPAALNNLFGWKPSCGAWPLSGVVPACASIDCVTVLANSLLDCEMVDRVVRGYASEDPWSKPFEHVPPTKPETIFIPREEPEFFGPYAIGYKKAWGLALEKIDHIGAQIKRFDCSSLERAAAILYEGPWVAERWADLGDFVESHPGQIWEVTDNILRNGTGYNAASLFQAIHEIYTIRAQVRSEFRNAVLIMPTCAGTWTREEVRLDPIRKNSAMGRYTNHCNLLDLSAVAVPAGFAAEDIPFGITLFALSGHEGLNSWAASDFAIQSG